MRQLFTLSDMDGWNEGIAIIEEMNKIRASKGWPQTTVFTRTVGRFGEVCLETEYPDLATMERVGKDWMEQPGIGKLNQRIDAIATEDPGYSELWEEATPLPD